MIKVCNLLVTAFAQNIATHPRTVAKSEIVLIFQSADKFLKIFIAFRFYLFFFTQTYLD